MLSFHATLYDYAPSDEMTLAEVSSMCIRLSASAEYASYIFSIGGNFSMKILHAAYERLKCADLQVVINRCLGLLVLYCGDLAVTADLDIVRAAGSPLFAKLCQVHHFLAAFWTDCEGGIIDKCRSAADGAALKLVAVACGNHFLREYKGCAVI